MSADKGRVDGEKHREQSPGGTAGYEIKSSMNRRGSRVVRPGRGMSSRERKIWGGAFLVFLLVIWELAARQIGKAFILPGPGRVLMRLWEERKEIFLTHLPATMQVCLLGLVISIALGLALAILMDLDPRIRRAVYPILTISQTIPVMCIAPAFVLWFGYTVKMRVIVVVLVNFFSITVNVSDGLASTRESRMELLRSYGASRWQCMTLLRLPGAWEHFLTALKVAIPWTAVGAAVAEWLGAPAGLGAYSRGCMLNLDAAGLLAPLVLLTAIALAAGGLVNAACKGRSAGRE
ncbi:MAG: ABC transporter permease [Lachnospiraceae bacterium]|nr:ABC transporter permease [Lachnospiraceae bacterium]